MADRRAAPKTMAAGVLLALAAACPPALEPRPPAELSLQIGTGHSCGNPSGLDYDTSCLAVVDVLVLDENTEVIEERCVRLDARVGELGELLRGDAILRTSGLSAKGKVYFEVRGLHDAGVGDDGLPLSADELCDRAALDDHWLFWGRSAQVDLAAYDAAGGTGVILVMLECRDCTFTQDCSSSRCYGCGGFGAGCPAALPMSFCTAVADCNKTCSNDLACFEGALPCVDGRCDDGAALGGLCGFCNDSGVGCADGFTCVGAPGAPTGRCAPLCPNVFCPAGTACTHTGPDLAIIG